MGFKQKDVMAPVLQLFIRQQDLENVVFFNNYTLCLIPTYQSLASIVRQVGPP